MRQRIVISGRGGQGVLTLTQVLAEAAAAAGHEVITSETHGMAQRGAAVMSTVKVGPFHGPLISPGEAEVGLFLDAANIPIHGHYLKNGGTVFVNGKGMTEHASLDAAALASSCGSPRSANLALLGYATGKGGLFADPACFEEAIRSVTSARHLDGNLKAFWAGVQASQ